MRRLEHEFFHTTRDITRLEITQDDVQIVAVVVHQVIQVIVLVGDAKPPGERVYAVDVVQARWVTDKQQPPSLAHELFHRLDLVCSKTALVSNDEERAGRAQPLLQVRSTPQHFHTTTRSRDAAK